MKEIVADFKANPKYSRAFAWGKLISITTLAQVLVQGIGLVSGILIIRLLPAQEYALYTLANTMLGTMTLLADGGISTAVMAQGGKVWQDKEKLGVILSTGITLRKKFAIVSLLIATPGLLYLLLHHGASILMSVLILLSLIPAFFSALSDTLFAVPPKLSQNIIDLQRNQIAANASRLLLTALTLFIFPWAFIAILAAGISRMWANVRLRKISMQYANFKQAPDVEIQRKILAVVKRMLPGAIYYCLSGQITIWLISIFGTTMAIAQVGALGRLTTLLTIFNVLFSTLIVPRFARLKNDKDLLLKRYIQIIIGLVLLSVLIIFTVWLFPKEVLWILGPEYASLTNEILLNIVGSCMNITAGSVFFLYTKRGWTIHPVATIGISLASIVIGIAVFDVSSLIGVFKMNIFLALVQVLMQVLYGLFKILNVRSTDTVVLSN